MTIKIAYRTQAEDTGQLHIAEAVTPDGDRLAAYHLVSAMDQARHGPILADYAKRQVLHNVIDSAIHQGLL